MPHISCKLSEHWIVIDISSVQTRFIISTLVLNISLCVIMSSTYYSTVHAGDYKREYPSAKLIAPKEAIENSSRGDKEVKFDGGD